MARKAKDVTISLKAKQQEPGGTVAGTVSADAGGGLEAVLAYVDSTGWYTEWTVHDRAELEADAGPAPFELHLPDNAYPAFKSERSKLGWAVIAGTEVKPGGTRLALEDVVVTPVKSIDEPMPSALAEGARFGNIRPSVNVTGPQPGPRRWEKSGGFLSKMSVNQQWDAPFEIDAGAVNRGDSVTVSVALEEPSETRHPIEAGVRCFEHWLSRETESDSNTKSMTTERELAYEEWIGFDPSVADHEIEIEIPTSAPFSYAGEVVYYEWKVGVVRPREDGTTKGPPERWLPLWVYP